MKRVASVSLALVAAMNLACSSGSSEPVGHYCPAAVRVDYSPAETTLVVGQQVTASLKIYECLSDVASRVTIDKWVSRDPGIATVESMSGLVTATGTGQTVLSAEADGHRYYGPWVTVR